VRGHLRPGGPEHVFVTSPRTWAQAGPETAEGIARSVIDFAAQVLTEDHEDVVDTLRQLEAVGVGQALDAHPTPAGSHPVRGGHRAGAPDARQRRTTHRIAHRGAFHRHRRTAPGTRHGRAGSHITHPLDHDLIAGRTGLCQGETSSVADLVKG
jgi:hypothetical protein